MKNRDKIILLSCGIVVAQFLASYFAYVTIPNDSSLLKIAVIMILNWLIAIIGLYITFNDYSNIFVGLNSFYGQYQTTVILYDLLKKLADVDEPKDIYQQIIESAAEAIPKATSGSVIMGKYGKMVYEASYGFKHEYLELIELDIHDTALYKLTEGKMDRPVIVPDILSINNHNTDEAKADMYVKAGADKIRSSISAPIIIAKAVEGSINLDSPEPNCFKESDIEILELFALEVGKFVQLHQTLELNQNMSRFDTLTNIYNRGYCEQAIKELMNNDNKFILISADLNNLKEVNDMYGHEVGDLLITSFVNNMRLFLPDDVVFARYGGDEFIFVFPNYDELNALVVMDDASNYFENHVIKDQGPPVSVSFCYGVSRFPAESQDYDELLKLADDRMYKQKRKYKSKLGL